MTIERILVVTGAAPSDEHAVIAACRLAARRPHRPHVRVLADREHGATAIGALTARAMVLTGGGVVPEVVTVRAPVATAAVAHAAAWGADLAVIGAGAGRDGRDSERLVHLLRIPVLVARRLTDARAIVAATDLVAPGFPVVRAAADEAILDAAALTIVHALEPRPHAQQPGDGGLAEWAEERRRAAVRRLERARDTVGAGDVAIVEAQVAEALDEVAGERRADLIVVGTRARRARGALVGRAAEAMIRHGRCSVLVIPIADDTRTRSSRNLNRGTDGISRSG